MLTALCTLTTLAAARGEERVFAVSTGAAADAGRRRSVEYIMSLSEPDLLAMVPVQSGIYFSDCPNCTGGSQDRGNWAWEPKAPYQLKCNHCGAVSPDNPKYPEKDAVTVKAPGGEHRYPYYQRPDGYRIFLRAHADYLRREYMARMCQTLAELYATTQDESCARRSALIADRFAVVYPGYANKFDYPFRQKQFAPWSEPTIPGVGAYRVSKWSWWAYMDISPELLRAYDILRFWPGLDRLGDGQVRRRLVGDLLGGMVRAVMAVQESYSNMSPGMWCDFIYAGRVLNHPEWVDEALKRVNTFLDRQFLYDGFWSESAPSYCHQVHGALSNVLASLKGYTPPTAAGSAAVERTQASRTRAEARVQALADALRAISLPNGGDPPVNDTWARTGTPRPSTESLLMPGLGLMILGCGQAEGQVYAWLNNTAGSGHKQSDALSIGLFAHGRELLTDIGYTHTAWRAWSLCTMSHNTVVVDGQNSAYDTRHEKTRLRVFATDRDRFHLTEAENDTAYAGVARRYRRTLLLVGGDGRGAYLVDVFQVSGGKQHDYLLHGTAAEASKATVTGVTLAPFAGTLLNPGVEFALPKGEGFTVGHAGGYGFIRNLSSGTSRGPVTVEFRCATAPDIGVRTYLALPQAIEIYVGEAPRLRPAERNDSLLPQFMAPVVCARRRGENLQTVFAAVHEPLRGTPTITAVAATPLPGGILITVEHTPDRRDYFVMSLDAPQSLSTDTPDGRLAFDGGWALARAAGGRLIDANIVEGRRLTLGDATLTTEPGWQGRIVRCRSTAGRDCRGVFEVDDAVPPAAAGGVMLLEFPDKSVRAFNVARVESTAGVTCLYVREDPGYVVAGDHIEWQTFPQRTIPGTAVRYRLPASTYLQAR